MSNTSPKDQDALLAGHRSTSAHPAARTGEEVWRVVRDGREVSCKLLDDSRSGAGWDVVVLQDGEWSFSRRCPDEPFARFVAGGLLQDHLRGGWQEC